MAKRQGSVEVKPAAVSAEEKALNNTISQIEKTFGAGAIMKLGEGSHLEVEGISTGALSLDLALGGKGLPRGRIIELFGPESSGKTTLALHAVANAQKTGGVAAFIDAEHALDPSWGKKLGVELEALLVSQPSNGEEALQIAEMLVKSNAVDVIVIDSVAALVPKAELEGEIGDTHVGLQARLMSQALRKLTGGVSRSKSVLIFINQIREKIGVMFGSPETTPGGRALKFYSSCRIDVRRIGPVKEGEDVIGSRIKVKVVKNKVGAAVPRRRVRHDVHRRHLPRGRPDRPGDRRQARREVGLVVQLRRPPARPGPRERQAVPPRQPRDRRGDHRQDHGHAGRRPSPRRLQWGRRGGLDRGVIEVASTSDRAAGGTIPEGESLPFHLVGFTVNHIDAVAGHGPGRGVGGLSDRTWPEEETVDVP